MNKQGNSLYYWTFTLGTSDGKGGKSPNAYLRDTPGVFNSINSDQDIKNENIAEKRKISTSKVNKAQREQDKKLMARKKVKEDQSLVIILYNEKVIGTFLGNFVQLSVIGLYATIVIAVGRFIRIIFDRIGQRLIFEELPNTKNLYELCEGIYIAQQQGDLVKEKQLYDLLVLLYRSPEALLKVTGTDINYVDDESDSKPTNRSEFDLGSGSSGSNSD